MSQANKKKGQLPLVLGSASSDGGRESIGTRRAPDFNDSKPFRQLEEARNVPSAPMTRGGHRSPISSRYPSGVIRYNAEGRRVKSERHRDTDALQWRDTENGEMARGPYYPMKPKEYTWPDKYGDRMEIHSPGDLKVVTSIRDLTSRSRRRAHSIGVVPSASSIHGSDRSGLSSYNWLPTESSLGMTDISKTTSDSAVEAAHDDDRVSSSPPVGPHPSGTAAVDDVESIGQMTATFGADQLEQKSREDPDRLQEFDALRTEFCTEEDQELEEALQRAFEYGDSIAKMRKYALRMTKVQVVAEAAASTALPSKQEKGGKPQSPSGESGEAARAETAGAKLREGKGDSDSADSAAVRNPDGSDNFFLFCFLHRGGCPCCRSDRRQLRSSRNFLQKCAIGQNRILHRTRSVRAGCPHM